MAFQKGQSGNPNGRPVGSKRFPPVSRTLFSQAFLADMQADWERNGKAVIETVRDVDPVAYLKVMASIIPKEHHVDARHEIAGQVTISEHIGWLERIVAGEEPPAYEVDVSDGSLLPAPVRVQQTGS